MFGSVLNFVNTPRRISIMDIRCDGHAIRIALSESALRLFKDSRNHVYSVRYDSEPMEARAHYERCMTRYRARETS